MKSLSGRIFELFKNCIQNNIPFYAYRKPDASPIMGGIQKSSEVLKFKRLSELKGRRGFIMVPFETAKKHPSWFLQTDIPINSNTISEEVMEWTETTCFEASELENGVIENTREVYLTQMQQLLNNLQSGKAKKTILSRIFTYNGCNQSNAPEIFKKLTESYSHAFLYLVHVPGKMTWIGASPEILLDFNGNRLMTVALAGTQKETKQEEHQVVWGEKEKEEQQIVSEYIEAVLRKNQFKDIKQKGPFTFRAGSVFHLKTEYRINKTVSLEQLSYIAEQLHPTPAVCGVPKKEAMELIRNLEVHDREYYTGYLGTWEGDGRCSLFVNLRCMKLMKDQIALYVGGGITRDSIPEDEWEETCLKADTLLQVIDNGYGKKR